MNLRGKKIREEEYNLNHLQIFFEIYNICIILQMFKNDMKHINDSMYFFI